MLYETNRNSQSIRETAATRHRVSPERVSSLPSSRDGRRRSALCAALESSVPRAGERGDFCSTTSRQTRKALRETEGGVNKRTLERSAGAGLFHRFMDLSPDCPGSPAEIRHFLPYPLYRSAFGCNELELSKTRGSCSGTKRKGDSTLGKKRLAPYKKKPGGSVQPLSLLTKRVFLCCRQCVGPGRPEAKLRSTATEPKVTKKSLELVQLVFRRNERDWGFIWDFIPTRISPKEKLFVFSGNWDTISEDGLLSCGIVPVSIVVNKWKSLSNLISDSSWSGFRRMRPSSIRLTTFGDILSFTVCPIMELEISGSWETASGAKLTELVIPKTFWRRLSMQLSYLYN